MKRLFAVLLVIGVALLSFSAYAGTGALYSGNKENEVLVYVSDNAAAAVKVTNVVTTTIIPGKHRVIGLTAVSLTGGAVSAGLFDTTNSTNPTAATSIGEWAAPAGNMVDYIYPYPKGIDTQLTILQSNASVVNVLYERFQP